MYKEVAIMWKNKESYVNEGGVFGLSIIKHVTLQKIVAHDFRYDSRITLRNQLPNTLQEHYSCKSRDQASYRSKTTNIMTLLHILERTC